jgi:hypothetical protein
MTESPGYGAGDSYARTSEQMGWRLPQRVNARRDFQSTSHSQLDRIIPDLMPIDVTTKAQATRGAIHNRGDRPNNRPPNKEIHAGSFSPSMCAWACCNFSGAHRERRSGSVSDRSLHLAIFTTRQATGVVPLLPHAPFSDTDTLFPGDHGT